MFTFNTEVNMNMERTKHEFIWIIILLFLSETCMDINGKLSTFFYFFWSERYLKVRVNSTFSDIHGQEMGVPIGNALSVILLALHGIGLLFMRLAIPRGGYRDSLDGGGRGPQIW